MPIQRNLKEREISEAIGDFKKHFVDAYPQANVVNYRLGDKEHSMESLYNQEILPRTDIGMAFIAAYSDEMKYGPRYLFYPVSL